MRVWRNWTPCALLVRKGNGTDALETSSLLPSKIKIELYYDPAVPLLGIYPPQFHAESCRNICILEFIAVLFTIAKIKESQHPFAHEWIN